MINRAKLKQYDPNIQRLSYRIFLIGIKGVIKINNEWKFQKRRKGNDRPPVIILLLNIFKH